MCQRELKREADRSDFKGGTYLVEETPCENLVQATQGVSLSRCCSHLAAVECLCAAVNCLVRSDDVA